MRHPTPNACAVVAVTAPGKHLTVAWCGDARAYLLAQGTAQRLTNDHNLRRVFPPSEMYPEGMYSQRGPSDRPAAAALPLAVGDPYQGVAHGGHTRIPAAAERLTPPAIRDPVQLHDLGLRPGDGAGFQRGHRSPASPTGTP